MTPTEIIANIDVIARARGMTALSVAPPVGVTAKVRLRSGGRSADILFAESPGNITNGLIAIRVHNACMELRA